MRIHFINVGYGEAILVEEGDARLLIDGGPSDPALLAGDGPVTAAAYLRARGIDRLDAVLMTHLHDDHISGLCEVLRTCRVGQIWSNIVPHGPLRQMLARMERHREDSLSAHLFYDAMTSYQTILGLAAEKNIPITAVCADSAPVRLGGLYLTFFGMDEKRMQETCAAFEEMICETAEDRLCSLFARNDRCCNATSLAVHVTGTHGSALLTGDKVAEWDHIAARHTIRADVLKLTHHGQIDGMPEAMLTGADPTVIVICADQNRRFHSACPEILSRASDYLREKGREAAVYVTGSLALPSGGLGNALVLDFPGTLPITKEIYKI